MTSDPSEYPVSVMGRVPNARAARSVPRTLPVFNARALAFPHGLSTIWPSLSKAIGESEERSAARTVRLMISDLTYFIAYDLMRSPRALASFFNASTS